MLLVDKQGQKVLAVGNPASNVTGDWKGWIESGRAVWVDELPGVPVDEVAVSAEGALSQDAAKKSAKDAALAANAARKQTIKTMKASANSIPALVAVVEALAKEMGFEVNP